MLDDGGSKKRKPPTLAWELLTLCIWRVCFLARKITYHPPRPVPPHRSQGRLIWISTLLRKEHREQLRGYRPLSTYLPGYLLQASKHPQRRCMVLARHRQYWRTVTYGSSSRLLLLLAFACVLAAALSGLPIQIQPAYPNPTHSKQLSPGQAAYR